MLVLGIDTSTKLGGIGLFDSEVGLIAENNLVLDQTHSERLMPMLQRLLNDLSLSIEDIDGYAVTLGPGSFTGTRIGVTTVKTLAQLANKPICGISTLEVTAYNLAQIPELICPIFDARNRRLYTAAFIGGRQGLTRVRPDESCSVEELVAELSTRQGLIYFLGDALQSYRSFIRDSLGERVVISPELFWLPRGGALAQLGYQRLISGEETDLFSLSPNYLKPSQAEINWKKKMESR